MTGQSHVTVMEEAVCFLLRASREEISVTVHHSRMGEVVSGPSECRPSSFFSSNNSSLTLLISMELVLQEDTFLHRALMTILPLCAAMNCNYG